MQRWQTPHRDAETGMQVAGCHQDFSHVHYSRQGVWCPILGAAQYDCGDPKEDHQEENTRSDHRPRKDLQVKTTGVNHIFNPKERRQVRMNSLQNHQEEVILEEVEVIARESREYLVEEVESTWLSVR